MTNQDETFLGKAYRKSIKEPLVPIGVLATTLFLGFGLQSFHAGNKQRAQSLMRGRVLAQGFTVIAMSAGAYFGIKPNNRPKNVEETLNKAKTGN